ncbi:MAG: permease [Lachnospiraceae bacterium]|nr:permease [Lachnospiraceae bacterium]
MVIPVYVVTGFLDSGKTTFISDLFNRKDWEDIKILFIQFESGEEEFKSRYDSCKNIIFTKKDIEEEPDGITRKIENFLKTYKPDEIWIEWNGMTPFSELYRLFSVMPLGATCKIKRVLHIADAESIENLLGKTGGALPEQIANSDFAVLRNARSKAVFRRIQRLMCGINPGLRIYGIKDYNNLYKQLFDNKEHPFSMFFIMFLFVVSIYIIAKPTLELFGFPVNTVINVFLGIILQAVPFLLIGVLLSSAIQVFVPRSVIDRRFPKSIGLGMLMAVISGFFLPVCDCASIPVFRSLVRKGIPLPVAVTFMVATPIINPVVILSTYYAFNGNMSVVFGRILFGIIAALIIGSVFALRPPKGYFLSDGGTDRIMCSCGCYEGSEKITVFSEKLFLFIRHSQAEFFSVGKYLIIGTFIASVFQAMGTGIFVSAQRGAGLAVSIIIMMVMAFVLSLCSSSDAVIARSFSSQFPMGAIMGFLIFGPMMDIKNLMMLSSGFSKRFIARLLLVMFTVCFSLVFLFFSLEV